MNFLILKIKYILSKASVTCFLFVFFFFKKIIAHRNQRGGDGGKEMHRIVNERKFYAVFIHTYIFSYTLVHIFIHIHIYN